MPKPTHAPLPARKFSILSLIAWPFIIGGVWLLFLSGSILYEAYQMKQWRATKADIISLRLQSHQNDGKRSHTLEGRYKFEFQSTVYENSRFGIDESKDNLGYYAKKFRYLNRMKRQSKAVQIWFNPKDPTQAVLDRKIRWKKLSIKSGMGLVFLIIGLALHFFIRYESRQIQKQSLLEQKHPDEPWLWQPEWYDGKIPGHNRLVLYFVLAITFFWNVLSLTTLNFIWRGLSKGNIEAYAIALFPLIGLLLIVWSIKRWQSWRQFGQSCLHIDTRQNKMGHTIKAVLSIPARFNVEGDANIELKCMQKGKGERHLQSLQKEKGQFILYSSMHQIPKHLFRQYAEKTRVDLHIELPKDLPETSVKYAFPHIRWQINVQFNSDRGQYQNSFIIPVFKAA